MSNKALEVPTVMEIRALCKALWSWKFCGDCAVNSKCISNTCPGQRLGRMAPFFRHYKALIFNYEPDLALGQSTVMRSHQDLAAIFSLIRSQPDVKRSAIRQQIMEKQLKPPSFSEYDVDVVLNLAVRAMFMVNCSADTVSPRLLEHGSDHVRWHDAATICDYVEEAFQATDDAMFGTKAECAPADVVNQLTAKKLMKRLKIRFVPTSDIRNHLRYDQQANTIEIYHHVALMKEHLRLTKDSNGATALSTADTVKLGALPRQIALEVVDSIQRLLFPLTDPKSFCLLRSLVSKHSMDPDCLRFESVAIRTDEEDEIRYLYFGSRLADLYEEMQNPQPRGGFEKWLERKSGARYVMLATLIGVFIAILLGIAGLAVSIYQAYIAYQAWKHPVSSS